MSIWNRFIGLINAEDSISNKKISVQYNALHYAIVDVEIGLEDYKIHDIGALRYDGAVYHKVSKEELFEFFSDVDYICGHNIIHHDAKYLFTDKTCRWLLVDTLYISPLLFPERPYHRLLKDDKLMSEQINNPVNDCEKAKDLLLDEIARWKSFPERKCRLFASLLKDKKEFEGVEYEDIDVIKQRDLHRLYVMEGYCKTTGCLRNYILNYFGENVTGVCGNCGNCNSEYEEIDMTAQAKWVINCIAETKGRFGQGIVIGTLLGADRARLKEVGAVNYKSYGKLAGMKEAELRPLIAQLISDGYIIQTQDEYSVLKMGDITPLKQENAHIYLKRMKESEEVKNAKLVGKTGSTGSSYEAGDETFLSGSGKKGRKQTGKAGKRSSSSTGKKSTDSLTSAGYELFERLKALRMIIAREEGMPPYIVFSDKTLIDMCEKLPLNAEAMLEVSGVGQNKLMKYGQRFVNEIDTFVKEHKGMAATIN